MADKFSLFVFLFLGVPALDFKDEKMQQWGIRGAEHGPGIDLEACTMSPDFTDVSSRLFISGLPKSHSRQSRGFIQISKDLNSEPAALALLG